MATESFKIRKKHVINVDSEIFSNMFKLKLLTFFFLNILYLYIQVYPKLYLIKEIANYASKLFKDWLNESLSKILHQLQCHIY